MYVPAAKCPALTDTVMSCAIEELTGTLAGFTDSQVPPVGEVTGGVTVIVTAAPVVEMSTVCAGTVPPTATLNVSAVGLAAMGPKLWPPPPEFVP